MSTQSIRILLYNLDTPQSASIIQSLEQYYTIDQATEEIEVLRMLYKDSYDILLLHENLNVDYGEGVYFVNTLQCLPRFIKLSVILLTNDMATTVREPALSSSGNI